MIGARFALLLCAAFLGGAEIADARAPERSPQPERRPAMAAQTTPPPARAIERAVAQALPQAGPRSAALSLAPARSPRPAPRRTRAQQRSPSVVVVVPVRAGGGGEQEAAGGRGLCGRPTLAGNRIAPITSSTRGCGIAEPVRITAVDGIPLSRMATLDCDAARALDRWVREQMRPAMGNTGGGVTQIDVAAHYVCRTRNHRPGARISEHGRGRAIDISGFRLANGQQVTVLRDYRGSPHARALQRMHRGACGIFTTTLGPGSDGFHEDHFHFDVAQRRNNATFCR